MTTERLAAHLVTICEQESITADSEAITAIARAAEGSVRDALSLLDQAAAMTADRMTLASITDMLGRPGRDDSIGVILDSAMQGDTPGALAAPSTTMAGGAEPEMIISDLMDLFIAPARAAGGSPIRCWRPKRQPSTTWRKWESRG